jgi:hypothetical protein
VGSGGVVVGEEALPPRAGFGTLSLARRRLGFRVEVVGDVVEYYIVFEERGEGVGEFGSYHAVVAGDVQLLEEGLVELPSEFRSGAEVGVLASFDEPDCGVERCFEGREFDLGCVEELSVSCSWPRMRSCSSLRRLTSIASA